MNNITKKELATAFSKINTEYNKEVKHILSPEEYTNYKILRAIKGLWAEKHLYHSLLQHFSPSIISRNKIIDDNGRTKDIDVMLEFPYDITIDAKSSSTHYSKPWNSHLYDWYYICEIGFHSRNIGEVCGYSVVKGDFMDLCDYKNVIFNPVGFYPFKEAEKNNYITKWKCISVEEWVKKVT